MSDRAAFLAGETPDDVALYVSEAAVDDVDALAERGERVDGGVVLVVPGERGRAAFSRAVGVDPMDFARAAMDREGHVDRDLTGGTCPDAGGSTDADEAGGEAADHGAAGGDEEHAIRYLFAFVEAENPEAGGLYAEGDVVHAYVQCACGTRYSDRWVAGGA